MGIMSVYHGIVMGVIIPCIMHTKAWLHIIHGGTLYMAKYGILLSTVAYCTLTNKNC